MAMSAMADPLTVVDGLSRDDLSEWKEAMQEDMDSLMENKTWTLEDLPKGNNIVSCKWIFKTKINPDGSLGYTSHFGPSSINSSPFENGSRVWETSIDQPSA